MSDPDVRCFHINPQIGYRCMNDAVATWRMPGSGDIDGSDSSWLAGRAMMVPLCERHGLMLDMERVSDSV